MAVNLVRPLCVDRITINVTIGSKDLYTHALEQLEGIEAEQESLLPGGKIKTTPKKYNTRLDYYPAYSHKRSGRRKIASVILGTSHKHRYLSLTLFPSQFKPGEFDHLKWVLATMLPEFLYPKLYATGKVSYLELAADTLSQEHHTFLPFRTHCNQSRIYKESSGHRGTTYIGSRSSKLLFRLYDKRKQLLDTDKARATDPAVHTRIEAVTRHLGCTPADIAQVPNPFTRLLIADLNHAQTMQGDEDWHSFIDQCMTADGAPDALAKLSPSRRKKYLGWLRSILVWWWKPDLIWEQLPQALAAIAP